MRMNLEPIKRGVCAMILLSGAVMLSGCASYRSIEGSAIEHTSETGRVRLEGVSYAQAFARAREVLADNRFAIDRIDATRGVISTHPKRTLGMVSPWDGEQSSLKQEWEDFANQQERTIRVAFAPVDGFTLASEGDFELTVEVIVHRVHRPNWRIETESVRLSSHAQSRDATGQLEFTSFREPIGHDPSLEARLVKAISDRVLGR